MNLGRRARLRYWFPWRRPLESAASAARQSKGMSRQPEAAGNIQTAMIISAALIEGCDATRT